MPMSTNKKIDAVGGFATGALGVGLWVGLFAGGPVVWAAAALGGLFGAALSQMG